MAFALETERLSLQLRDRDDATWNLELLRERGDGTPRTLSGVQAQLDEQRARAFETGLGFLTMRRRLEGDVIGYCGLLVGRSTFDEPEIAYELFRRHHGCGYATEAARAVLDAAFATGRRRLWATVRDWNTPSFNVLEKIGFSRHHCATDEQGELVYMVRDA